MSSSKVIADMSRRTFLQGSACLLTAAGLIETSLAAEESARRLRVGLVTDLHHADKPAAGTRYYRETTVKLAEAAERLQRERIDLLIELGDLIDAADSVDVELGYLKTIQQQFAAICPERHYVLGNHCVETLTKAEFLAGVGQSQSFYSFDRVGWHFVVLDACFRADGEPYGRKNSKWDDANIPADELAWLREDLANATGPVVILAHQRLDGDNRHCVKNAADVRSILSATGQVRAVFQGHSHQNDHKLIDGIHYCTLAAMIEGTGAESNGYAMLDILADGRLLLHGFRRQATYTWS